MAGRRARRVTDVQVAPGLAARAVHRQRVVHRRLHHKAVERRAEDAVVVIPAATGAGCRVLGRAGRWQDAQGRGLHSPLHAMKRTGQARHGSQHCAERHLLTRAGSAVVSSVARPYTTPCACGDSLSPALGCVRPGCSLRQAAARPRC